MLTLTDQELFRYDRQITLHGFDIEKQQILKNSSVLIIGLGGLGCSTSLYLAASGIGKLTLNDFDTISASNLNRQILYTYKSINQNKVDVAKYALVNINPNIQINTVNQQLDDRDLISLIKQHNIIIDCTDNLVTREQINRCCFQEKKPLVSGAAIRMEGLLSVFTYQPNEPCYHCLSRLFGNEQLTCVETGVMAPLVGMFGSMQAIEAIKVLTHYGHPLSGRLLMVDTMNMQFNQFTLSKQENCPVCGNHRTDQSEK
ncbi:molybdopterin-synthase adenylyltransferase MoeB [Gilliamella sp. B2776]|uniref:molybdopterin-synthase adenylyltransferase MoeB n=1 Tax=unclassified Gilliamella TaxID=2685620 RepID=UPI002269E030|nr:MULTISPECIES: molybdopterin-synthase adenylyltransferase MoeB [unclassified Gilliamella]MCX8648748.1 molybdopterin-synthase adenylyltransferase MoeB [Gilliamella sp. B2779]MCX8653376.1 molybdopterin-synthase adenylyltransferase MoeB [Gilliamella sp. B2737]MCX8664402.1 molybdopterin-synthase adenylyltransferase MoeB [Gilliamella sp. B2887]MCX8690560.1 molybdopterin-synthase adenylyltransferase MoeB [Gilliamella sp. B2776]MCX8698904.1 molybdopterin-synthase adenylyltransferase MoeB [Gilliamel